MSELVTAYIGLGSNLGNSVQEINNAVAFLNSLPGSQVEKVSHCYQTSPVGVDDHPEYINAVAAVKTTLLAEDLLDQLLNYEETAGRQRIKNEVTPRPIDLDILLYGDQIIDEINLQIPHPRLFERGFVLVPLHEIEPKLVFPGGEVLQLVLEVWETHSNDSVKKVDDE